MNSLLCMKLLPSTNCQPLYGCCCVTLPLHVRPDLNRRDITAMAQDILTATVRHLVLDCTRQLFSQARVVFDGIDKAGMSGDHKLCEAGECVLNSQSSLFTNQN